ncbi:DUF1963 domain-containing protein [Curtobacterium sp. TC1]|uniref:DUF1963 domain-containing protein n=1 Tax=Curtobacterium sp. TC1 TaxID=2862880 RepID=UPI001C9B6BC9|nr:DUF1963 domain-containing protein [Curtobacterium sp. TC1]QZQ53832.1 DUF1963 domain-containing protein [Curtobacterium sp. TC1]
MSVTAGTEEAARVRASATKNPWNGIYAMAYLFGVIAFIAISVYENAWQYRDVTEANLIALAWTTPFAVAAHLIHFLTSRGRGTRRRRALDDVVAQVNAAAAAAGFPRLQQGPLRRMLTANDNGLQPYTGQGKFPPQPMLTWTLPTDDPAVLVTAIRAGTPETVTLELATTSAPIERQQMHPVSILGAHPHTAEASITASRLGGRPAAPADFTWPTCAEHHTTMQFLAQVEDHERLLLVIMCNTDPGSCETWDPDAGCNAVIAVTGRALQLATPPTDDAIASGGAAPPRRPHL